MKVSINKEKTELTVTLPIDVHDSGSGKSVVIASTSGNKASDVKWDGKPIVIGLNAYVKK